jgi:iron(III) transport system substrate-binding protein
MTMLRHACAVLLLSSGFAQAGALTIYSALEEGEIADYLAVARKSLPDIEINVVRLSTGELGARVVAEAASPQHDVIWGFAVTDMVDERVLALLEPYKAKGADKLAPRFRAADDKWFAVTGSMAAFCVNYERLKAKQLHGPRDWADLAEPRYKGEVVMPNPLSSATGYLQIAGILQRLGDERGWKLIKELDANVVQYINSGTLPCRAARAGEFTVGASLAFTAIQSIDEGFPITMVIPAAGTGFELEGSAIMLRSRNKTDARRFLDWTLSGEAATIYGRHKELVTITGFKPSTTAQKAGLPDDVASALVAMDFAKSARNRDAILARWKSEIGR